jgi:hypothetical protein
VRLRLSLMQAQRGVYSVSGALADGGGAGGAARLAAVMAALQRALQPP